MKSENSSRQRQMSVANIAGNPKLDRQTLATRLIGQPQSDQHQRGTERELGFYCQDSALFDGKSQICWAGLPIPLTQANLHFLIAGVPGSGKTLTFRLLMQSVFSSRSTLPGNDRGVIYDPKQEFYTILRGMGVPADRLRIVNPFDCRSYAWHLPDDYRSPADAFQLAKTLIPCPESHSQPFFPKSAAAVLTGVICALMEKNPTGWDLGDIILNCLNEKMISDLLGSVSWTPYTELARGALGASETKSNVLAELSSQLYEYLPIASRWRAAAKQGRRFSMHEFIEQPDQILLLGANQMYSQSIQTVNKLLVKRLSEIVIDETADGQWEAMNRTWMILDELRELGKVPGLSDCINKGRSRGICAVLGFQDYLGLKESFGENAAHELTATCSHKIFLRLGGESAAWASKMIGRSEVISTTFSFNSGSHVGFSSQIGQATSIGNSVTSGISSQTLLHPGQSHESSTASIGRTSSSSTGFSANFSSNVSRNQQIRETDAVLPSEISNLPGFEEGKGLTGFVVVRNDTGKTVVRQLHLPSELLIGLLETSDEDGFVPWQPHHLEW